MDEPYAVDTTSHGGSLAAAKLQEKSEAESSSSHPMNEGIKCAQKIAKISVITLLSIGIVELDWPNKWKRSRNR
jgi:hypothetical protein